ncbi:DNA polymerase I [Tessaracoccus sp. OH4464_COT-324]|uniref:DNA polymerase I n=1 Tax=Tessaracoccus sp. OH4464_COT-324 TaxID=2491059 RepID=UPI000F63E8DC|nr:DNA polymerase I [Tessaracoccus sp. OH4464_COT-324]RRD47687.1 DNA polymerase I [Tessaracoccus sp. OH4464_COT-324]
MDKLLLIDGHSMAYRAFFALPAENFATKTGQHTNAVYGFTTMLLSLLRDEKPTHVAVAFDVSRHSFRTDSYPEYKATRSKSPEEFRGQVELIKDLLAALRIVHVEKEGFEADDLIATLATTAAGEGMHVAIVSGDRDALQLVTDSVTVLYPRKGVSDLARMTPAAVEEKHLVSPERYPELAALVGETSDNLPGVPGVGPKTAAKWLAEYDGLENLLARAEQVRGKAGENLRIHLADVERNRRLNALVRDVELPIRAEDLARREPDLPAALQLLDTLEIKQLQPRLAEFSEDEGRSRVIEVTGEPLSPGAVGAWLASRAGLVAVHFEGHWGRGVGDITGLAFACSETEAFVDAAQLTPEDDEALALWLADPRRPKTLHDAKSPRLALAQRGWSLEGVKTDTLLAGYLLHPEQRDLSLESLVRKYLRCTLEADDRDESTQQAFDFDSETARPRTTMVRARAVRALADVLTPLLVEMNQNRLLVDLEQPLSAVLAKMERVGIAVDVEKLDHLRASFDESARQAQREAYGAIGREVNLSSPKQLQEVLFDQLKMPKTRKTKSGYTTDAEALADLYAKTGEPFLRHLLTHRDQLKLRQTVDGLISAVAADGRIHTTYQQTVAATGRLSSTDPNLQNIPIRTPLGRQIRSAFVPGTGFVSLMSADYSQIEMRLMADGSGDPGMVEAFRSGRDFHNEMAATVFGVEPASVTPEMRARIKAMNYGLAYGLSAYGLSQQLQISVAEAKALMADYFARLGSVKDYLDGIVATARQLGYTETMLGRRRPLPDLNSPNRLRREMAERAALNSPIQGSAADVIKLAMLAVDEKLSDAGMASRVLLQVHDELLLEVADGEEEALEELVISAMESAADLKVPLAVSVGKGENWEAAAH